jgi:hypothetical protein
MTHLPFESALRVSQAMNLSDWDAYIYHSVELPVDCFDAFEYYNALYAHFNKLISGRSFSYYKALMKNSSVKRLNDLMLFFLSCNFGDLEGV